MAITFSNANNSVTALGSDICLAALKELGAISPEEKLGQPDGDWCLQKLQRLIDQFNARRELIFAHSFALFNLLANHDPHTIGPNGDFNVPIRPVEIVSASWILSGSSANPVDQPIKIRDHQWYAALPVKSLTSSISTDLYYEPTGPLGAAHFYPISNVANQVRLESWISLAQPISLNSPLGFVQGYWDAITLDLAIRLAPSYEKTVSEELREQWNRAMRIIEANNDEPPRIDTNSAMPSSNRVSRPDFNFLTGLRE